MGKSSFYCQHRLIRRVTRMPCPLSVIWSNLRPPSLMRMSIWVDPASMEFSMSSFSAFDGRWMISPAAILSTTWVSWRNEDFTFLSRRRIGLRSSCGLWGRFVPLGDVGGSMERVDGKSNGDEIPRRRSLISMDCHNLGQNRLPTYVGDGNITTRGTSVNVALYSCRTCGNRNDGNETSEA